MAESNVLFDAQVFLNPNPSYHNKCSASHVWDGRYKWYPRLRVSVFAIFIVYYGFLMPALFVWARRASSRAKRILQWHTYIPAVVSMFIWLLIALVADSFLNCLKISGLKYLKIFVAVNVFRNIASVLMLAIVIGPVASALQDHARLSSRFSKLGHYVLLCLVAIFAVLHVIIWDYNNIHTIKGTKIVEDKNAISATYITLYFVAALSGAAHILRGCWAAKSKKISLEGISPFGVLLALSLFGFAVIDMIVIYRYKVQNKTWTRAASLTFGILSLSFQSCVFALIPLVARSRALGLNESHDHHHERKSLRSNGTPEPAAPKNGTNGTHV